MAKNTGDGHRNGAVKKRSQVENPEVISPNAIPKQGNLWIRSRILDLSKVYAKRNPKLTTAHPNSF